MGYYANTKPELYKYFCYTPWPGWTKYNYISYLCFRLSSFSCMAIHKIRLLQETYCAQRKSLKVDTQTSWQTGNKQGCRFINQSEKKKKIIGSIYRSKEQWLCRRLDGNGNHHLHHHVQGAAQPHHLWLEETRRLVLKY